MYMAKKHYTKKLEMKHIEPMVFACKYIGVNPVSFSKHPQKPLLGMPQVLISNPAKPRTHTLLGASGPVQENEMPGNPGLYFLILVAGPGAL
jgi:hypothetical protein